MSNQPDHPESRPIVFWIKNGMAYAHEPEAGSWSYHVVEHSALQRAEARIAELERIGHDCTLEWNQQLTAAEACVKELEVCYRMADNARKIEQEKLAQAEREAEAFAIEANEILFAAHTERDTLRAELDNKRGAMTLELKRMRDENERLRAALERIASDPEIMRKSCASIAREALSVDAVWRKNGE